jgi:hypothetical protein
MHYYSEQTMNKIVYAAIATGMLMASCQSKEEKAAQGAVDRYVIFVDSVDKAKYDKRKERWDFIEAEHKHKRNDAEAALPVFKGSTQEKQRKRISDRDAKYKGIKVSVKE